VQRPNYRAVSDSQSFIGGELEFHRFGGVANVPSAVAMLLYSRGNFFPPVQIALILPNIGFLSRQAAIDTDLSTIIALAEDRGALGSVNARAQAATDGAVHRTGCEIRQAAGARRTGFLLFQNWACYLAQSG
jgi:hypothetical protein